MQQDSGKNIFRQLWNSKDIKPIGLIVGAVLFVLVLNVLGEMRMNTWQGEFFRAIEKKDIPQVGTQSAIFVIIMVILLSFIVTQNWLLEQFKIRFRKWLSSHLIDEWIKPGRAYRLNIVSKESLNPDQRIQEDVKHFSELTGDLALGAFRASLFLLTFVGVLWSMSQGVIFNLGNMTVSIPGYMVWFAVIYALLGSFLATRVGRPLIKLNEERYTREANLRYALVRVSDNAEGIAFYGGEKDERKILDDQLNLTLNIMRRLSFAQARLTWIACGHGWMVVILPVLVALPAYLQGRLDFGGLMMAVGAFNHVQQSLRWFVENYSRIADWKSVLNRVSHFEEELTTIDSVRTDIPQVEVLTHRTHYSMESTCITSADGKSIVDNASMHILLGDRILLTGDSGAGKSTILRVLAGIWPWGTGKISIPPPTSTMFLPQKPYVPLGTLLDAVAYPLSSAQIDKKKILAALERVNLSEFQPLADQNIRWDKLMSLGQQQRLAFARLLIHRPQWIFLDEATSALDENNQKNVMSIFNNELRTSTLVSVGHRLSLAEFHSQIFEVVNTDDGRVLRRKSKEPSSSGMPLPVVASTNDLI
ncbi:ABC transporter ATP-binding protein/permease [Bdellovibrio sp. SKB1291214]|uniref:ABC transporter ATP-binding protein/permease n=1 Tax=Bdellovibrio sp. SKB1291214 TaxID=1732569 RepID=UPI000B51CA75|nr:ABC transporter ATP-binding protein/permease [Bdellovibrio sp. SKB1291214]UYL07281.1 ABC transporter ATP-binding protein/permease [Bdellovibrio sp. SKB1291214]